MSASPDHRKPFGWHGVEFTRETETQWLGVCPECGKEKFYVSKTNGLWDCKVCGNSGNVGQFLMRVAADYEQAMTPKLLRQLASDRNLPVDAFAGWHIGSDGRRYMLPVFSPFGNSVTDIRIYDPRTGRLFGTAGCEVGLFGAEQLAKDTGAPVYLFEGEWDCIAGQRLLRSAEKRGVCIGVPGANVFKQEWAQLLRGRIVHTHYDNDEPGRQGEERAGKSLAGFAKTLTFLHWPKSKSDGYDVRDFVTERPTSGGLFLPRLRWNQLRGWYRDTPRNGAIVSVSTDLPAHISEFDRRLLICSSIGDAIAILNERHFTIQIGNKQVVGDERADKLVSWLPYKEFKNRYVWHRRWADGTGLGTLYLDSVEHRHFDGRVVFRPPGSAENTNKDDYNLWRGFSVQPAPGDWSKFKAHLLDNVCNKKRKWYHYLLNYFADMVQRPGRLPSVAIVLRGPEGVGKTLVFNYLSQMFAPEHTLLVSSPRGLVGKFNQHLSNKVLVLADEAFFAGDHSMVGTLQSLITSPRQLVEPKFVDAFEVDNCLHLIIASNSQRVIQAARQARRYFVLDVGDECQKNFPYFDAITRQQRNGGTAAMLHELLARDISGFNAMEFPDTPALNEQKELSLQPHEAWLRERLLDAVGWSQDVEKDRFYGTYLQWTKDLGNPGRYPQTKTQLTKYLQDVFGARIRFRPHGQKRRYRFPDLAECRRIFDAHHDLKTVWEPASGMIRIRRTR